MPPPMAGLGDQSDRGCSQTSVVLPLPLPTRPQPVPVSPGLSHAPGLTAAVPPGPMASPSTLRVIVHLHEPPPSIENHAAGQPRPRHTGHDVDGLAEEPDGSSPRWTAAPPSLPWCPVPSPVPLHFLLLWVEDAIRDPPRKERPRRTTQRPPAFKSLRSLGDTLHTFPWDRPDPKTLDQGRPLRGGAFLPGLSLHSHLSSD